MTARSPNRQTPSGSTPDHDVMVVGAGFAGLYMLHATRELGLSCHVFEAARGVGGTWFWNRYPGARCDVESVDYSYSFDARIRDEWRWSERYPASAEIRSYLNFVADRLELRTDISLSTTVTSATFDEPTALWTVETNDGRTVTARWLIMATGCLSAARTPHLPGAERFAGQSAHTSDWLENEIDVTGKRVAVIGTGSSGVQAIPVLAAQAAQLTVFQRTAGFVVPARNRPLPADEAAAIEAGYSSRREHLRTSFGGFMLPTPNGPAGESSPEAREAEFERRWQIGGLCIQTTFSDVMTSLEANELTADFIRAKIRATVRDERTAEALCPRGYPLGARRLTVGTDYYETYNRDNVTLVDLRQTPITTLTERGIQTTETEWDIDVLVYATGFDAMTGALGRIDIHGRAGRTLREAWAAGPQTYLGLSVADFPNLFLLAGPGSPSVMSNVVVSIEQHVEWVSGLLAHLRSTHARTVEADPQAQEDWVAHANAVAAGSLYMQADSWYLGANVPGKPRVFMPYLGGVGTYRKICAAVAADDYKGLIIHARDLQESPSAIP